MLIEKLTVAHLLTVFLTHCDKSCRTVYMNPSLVLDVTVIILFQTAITIFVYDTLPLNKFAWQPC
jgi:hypothetical protein